MAMRRVSICILAALSLVSSHAAFAADMPVKAAPTAIPYSWTGFYVGATAGYVFGSSQHCDTVAFCTSAFDVNGAAGGATLGYNWQAANWVYGLEADFSFAGAKGTTLTIPPPFGFNCGTPNCYTNLDWFGTVRGRVGPAFGNWLPYLTGGFAYGQLNAGLSSAFAPTTSATAVRGGWTLGGGVEYALAPLHWSVKLEYLYLHLDDLFYDTAQVCGRLSCTAVHNNFNVVRLGVNYRF
jgi:outer membrane immunogenic protein